MKFTVLGSGSGGNCAVIEAGETRLLIDAGLSAGQILSRLDVVGVDPASLTAILLTHEHGDHTRGLEVLTKRFPLPIYCNALTRDVLLDTVKSEKQWRLVQTSSRFAIGGLELDAFSVPHDAVDPMGFVVRGAGGILGVLSDVGHATRLIRERLKGVHSLFVESNYDGTLLQDDPKRPWSTKQRIMSQHGHMSNHQTAQLVAEIAHDGLERIVLGHLSQDCNAPDLAAKFVRDALAAVGQHQVEIVCAGQDQPTAWLPVRLKSGPPASPDPVSAPSLHLPLVQGELF